MLRIFGAVVCPLLQPLANPHDIMYCHKTSKTKAGDLVLRSQPRPLEAKIPKLAKPLASGVLDPPLTPLGPCRRVAEGGFGLYFVVFWCYGEFWLALGWIFVLFSKDFRRIFHGCSSDFRWIFVGFSLDVRLIFVLIFVGFSLDSRWMFVGFSLDFRWMFVGFSLDSRWILVGFSLDFLWICNLPWISMDL